MDNPLLYQVDSYLKEFNASVMDTDPESHAILLDQTAFFPGGGGQLYDTGFLIIEDQKLNVIRARHSPKGVMHEMDSNVPLLKAGTPVKGILDWERRYQLMRTHTAMHILCGVIFRDFQVLVTGGDMEPLKGRMDFEFESLTRDLVKVIEDAVNREVAASHPVKISILPREEAFRIPDLIRTKINLLPEHITSIRIVEIVGLDLQADGGTHVNNTSEVGTMHMVDYKSKGKINKRIYIELDP